MGYKLLATLNSSNKTYTIPTHIHDIKLAFATPFYHGSCGFCDENPTDAHYGYAGCMFNNSSTTVTNTDSGVAYGWDKTTRVLTYYNSVQNGTTSAGEIQVFGRE